jgi:F0F1-type ATP synthase membrane subunit b/b'
MKSQLIQSMGSFVLGGSVALVGLASWLGTSDLEEIKQSVQFYVAESEDHASALLADYNVTVENANAEIGEYKVALEQANNNIADLITIYEIKVSELENANATYEQDLADLEQALADMQTRLDQQYESDMNAIIEQANAEINKANEEVAQTKTDVNTMIEGSQVDEIVNGERLQLDTTGNKTVTNIDSIIREVEGE